MSASKARKIVELYREIEKRDAEIALLRANLELQQLRYGVVSGWIVKALKVLDTLDPEDTHEADELRKLIAAGEVLALTTLANSKTPNVRAKRPSGAAQE